MPQRLSQLVARHLFVDVDKSVCVTQPAGVVVVVVVEVVVVVVVLVVEGEQRESRERKAVRESTERETQRERGRESPREVPKRPSPSQPLSLLSFSLSVCPQLFAFNCSLIALN